MDSVAALLNTALAPFDYQPRTRIVFGVNSVDRAGELAKELDARSVLLVTDRGIVSAGHAARVAKLLETQGMKVACLWRGAGESQHGRCGRLRGRGA